MVKFDKKNNKGFYFIIIFLGIGSDSHETRKFIFNNVFLKNNDKNMIGGKEMLKMEERSYVLGIQLC